MPREPSIKASIVKALRARGWWVTSWPTNNMSRSGMPDLLALLNHPPGRALWIEAKQLGKHATKLQIAVMTELRAAGAITVVAHNREEAIQAAEDAERNWKERSQ